MHMPVVAQAILGDPNWGLSKVEKELRYGTNGSLSVDLEKGTWYDYSESRGGGVLDFIKVRKGLEGVEAFAFLKELGCDVDERPRPNGAQRNGHDDHASRPAVEEKQRRPKREIVGTFDYVGADGELSYQVARFQFRAADGKWERNKDGKIKKTFGQRRPAPDGPGLWIWGLDLVDRNGEPLEFMRKGPGKDWSRFDERDFKEWRYTERRTFPGANIQHSLYRLPELLEALAMERLVFIVEGEKKVDRLIAEGAPATCNSGGAGKFGDHLVEYFRDADVVILPDNDPQSTNAEGAVLFHPDGRPKIPGKDHADLVASKLHGIAARVRVLELPDLPLKGDIVDWLAEGGVIGELYDLVETAAQDWRPRAAQQQDAPWDGPPAQQAPARAPRFKMVHFGDVKVSSRPRYLVRGLIPLTGVVVIWGPPKCGKSFWTSDLLFHVALGWSYRNRKVEQGAVVYVILEGETGFSDRIEAFRQRFLEGRTEPVPFYVISQRLNLVADHMQLITDIRAQLPAGVNPAVVAIDTLNRSLQGSESSDQDMGNYVKAADAVRTAFNCVVPIVHHCGIESARPRGHSSLTGAADAQISIRRDPAKNVVTSVEYMKDGPEGDTLVSKLQVVNVGKEPDGHPITSCIVVALGDDEALQQKTAAQGFALRPTEEPIFRALLAALRKAPVAPNEEMVALGVPADRMAVHYRDWREAYKVEGVAGGEAGEAPGDDAIRKRFDRYSRFMISSDVLVWKRPWLSWTGKMIRGFPETRPKDAGDRTTTGQWSDRALDHALSDADENRTDGGQADIDELFGRS